MFLLKPKGGTNMTENEVKKEKPKVVVLAINVNQANILVKAIETATENKEVTPEIGVLNNLKGRLKNMVDKRGRGE
jgi:hypothetical protein